MTLVKVSTKCNVFKKRKYLPPLVINDYIRKTICGLEGPCNLDKDAVTKGETAKKSLRHNKKKVSTILYIPYTHYSYCGGPPEMLAVGKIQTDKKLRD